MKFLVLITIVFFGCKGHKYIETRYFSKEDQIDTLVGSQARLMRQCLEEYSLTPNEHGSDDSSTLTYFCDTMGTVSMIEVINFYPTKEVYQTYFSKGNISKIAVEYSRESPFYQEHSDYYIDHDSLFLKKESNRKFEIDNWISLNKQYYKDYNSIKTN